MTYFACMCSGIRKRQAHVMYWFVVFSYETTFPSMLSLLLKNLLHVLISLVTVTARQVLGRMSDKSKPSTGKVSTRALNFCLRTLTGVFSLLQNVNSISAGSFSLHSSNGIITSRQSCPSMMQFDDINIVHQAK